MSNVNSSSLNDGQLNVFILNGVFLVLLFTKPPDNYLFKKIC